MTGSHDMQSQQQNFAMKSILDAKDAITMAQGRLNHANNSDAELLVDFLQSLQTFECEIYFQRQEWDLLLKTVQVRVFSGNSFQFSFVDGDKGSREEFYFTPDI